MIRIPIITGKVSRSTHGILITHETLRSQIDMKLQLNLAFGPGTFGLMSNIVNCTPKSMSGRGYDPLRFVASSFIQPAALCNLPTPDHSAFSYLLGYWHYW